MQEVLTERGHREAPEDEKGRDCHSEALKRASLRVGNHEPQGCRLLADCSLLPVSRLTGTSFNGPGKIRTLRAFLWNIFQVAKGNDDSFIYLKNILDSLEKGGKTYQNIHNQVVNGKVHNNSVHSKS